jgi:hypothetical protein
MTKPEADRAVATMHVLLLGCAAILRDQPTAIAEQMVFDRVVAQELPKLVAEVASLLGAIVKD